MTYSTRHKIDALEYMLETLEARQEKTHEYDEETFNILEHTLENTLKAEYSEETRYGTHN